MSSEDGRPRIGLRERKKAKTRAAIQEHALRLFLEQGYDETTVEQIAEAAEVSPSTFFRYFPTKEDVVLYDVLDPVLLAAFRAQPPELSPIAALRSAFGVVFGALSGDEMEVMRERARLMQSVPELRLRVLDELARSVALVAEIAAERVGRHSDDFAIRNLAGAILGVVIGAWLFSPSDLPEDFVSQMDAALAHLEAGLPL